MPFLTYLLRIDKLKARLSYQLTGLQVQALAVALNATRLSTPNRAMFITYLVLENTQKEILVAYVSS